MVWSQQAEEPRFCGGTRWCCRCCLGSGSATGHRLGQAWLHHPSSLHCRAVRSGITLNSNLEFQQVSLSGHFLFLLCRQSQWFPAQEFCSLHIALPVFLSDVGKIPNSAIGELTCARNEPPEDKSAFPIELLRLYIDGMCSSGRENLTKLWLRISPGCLMELRLLLGTRKV